MLKKELTLALNYALNKGFQIHPDAFEFLENVNVQKLEKIIIFHGLILRGVKYLKVSVKKQNKNYFKSIKMT